MHYLVDGYNLLFCFFDDEKKLANQRENLIQFFETILSKQNVSLTIIFDGTKVKPSDANHEYFQSFDVVFTEGGQSADDYILEIVSSKKHPADYTVVSSDKRLSLQCRTYGAQTLTNQAFLKRFSSSKKKKRTEEKASSRDSDANIQRLLKIFEEKLIDENEDQ